MLALLNWITPKVSNKKSGDYNVVRNTKISTFVRDLEISNLYTELVAHVAVLVQGGGGGRTLPIRVLCSFELLTYGMAHNCRKMLTLKMNYLMSSKKGLVSFLMQKINLK